jgi:hypothetical protein
MSACTSTRRCKLLLRADAGGPGLPAIWDGRRKRPHVYWLAMIPGGVKATKFREPGMVYTVRRVASGWQCSCRASAVGRACKYRWAVAPLVLPGAAAVVGVTRTT